MNFKANIKDTKLRKFLTHAAYRFTVFNYDQIAEYYSHLPQNERKIFEKQPSLSSITIMLLKMGLLK